jgi:hypothetical protein
LHLGPLAAILAQSELLELDAPAFSRPPRLLEPPPRDAPLPAHPKLATFLELRLPMQRASPRLARQPALRPLAHPQREQLRVLQRLARSVHREQRPVSQWPEPHLERRVLLRQRQEQHLASRPLVLLPQEQLQRAACARPSLRLLLPLFLRQPRLLLSLQRPRDRGNVSGLFRRRLNPPNSSASFFR